MHIWESPVIKERLGSGKRSFLLGGSLIVCADRWSGRKAFADGVDLGENGDVWQLAISFGRTFCERVEMFGAK
jgi:hypothetical protein